LLEQLISKEKLETFSLEKPPHVVTIFAIFLLPQTKVPKQMGPSSIYVEIVKKLFKSFRQVVSMKILLMNLNGGMMVW
jgi:hypothetical protein